MMIYFVTYIDFYLWVLLMIVELIVKTEIFRKEIQPTYILFFSMLRQYKNFFRPQATKIVI